MRKEAASALKSAVEVATAKALLIKEGQLKKRAAHIKKAALFKALPNERALEAAKGTGRTGRSPASGASGRLLR